MSSRKDFNLVYISLVSVFVFSYFQTTQTTNEGFRLRKCCREDEYYNNVSQTCEPFDYAEKFQQAVQYYLVRDNVTSLHLSFGRLTHCADGEDCPEISLILNQKSHILLSNGHMYEPFHEVDYDMQHYCVELLGDTQESTSLAIAYCLPESSTIPKCCPAGHYFDTKALKCSSNEDVGEFENSLQSSMTVGDYKIKYIRELQCAKAFPEQFLINNGIFLDDCNNVCLGSLKQCYSARKYCIDDTYNGMYFSASVFVCADNVTKTCCRGDGVSDEACSCTP